MSEAAALRAEEIGTVEDRFFTLRDFRLANGVVVPEATIAYETYGRLAQPNGPNGGRNAILCTHGYTASHHFAGRNPANGNQPGSWDGLFDDRGRATALANHATWLDQSRDPERLAVNLGAVAASGVPVTVTTGSRSLPAYPEIAARTVAALPGADLVTVAGAGHGVQLSHPDAFAEIVLARVRAGVSG